ncbi:hypothetical protein BLNAU_20030 [Blattamonas nauphoetae]|uniref:Uncharacterized protein n=1 Tax=Blattamonas nauphoetae TaxID=2049346 RepID=A0ABQ9WZS0_9EUKA|nr:hypothetical protein BLNAU_20030 [Blattamonas nauphoetae]
METEVDMFPAYTTASIFGETPDSLPERSLWLTKKQNSKKKVQPRDLSQNKDNSEEERNPKLTLRELQEVPRELLENLREHNINGFRTLIRLWAPAFFSPESLALMDPAEFTQQGGGENPFLSLKEVATAGYHTQPTQAHMFISLLTTDDLEYLQKIVGVHRGKNPTRIEQTMHSENTSRTSPSSKKMSSPVHSYQQKASPLQKSVVVSSSTPSGLRDSFDNFSSPGKPAQDLINTFQTVHDEKEDMNISHDDLSDMEEEEEDENEVHFYEEQNPINQDIDISKKSVLRRMCIEHQSAETEEEDKDMGERVIQMRRQIEAEFIEEQRQRDLRRDKENKQRKRAIARAIHREKERKLRVVKELGEHEWEMRKRSGLQPAHRDTDNSDRLLPPAPTESLPNSQRSFSPQKSQPSHPHAPTDSLYNQQGSLFLQKSQPSHPQTLSHNKRSEDSPSFSTTPQPTDRTISSYQTLNSQLSSLYSFQPTPEQSRSIQEMINKASPRSSNKPQPYLNTRPIFPVVPERFQLRKVESMKKKRKIRIQQEIDDITTESGVLTRIDSVFTTDSPTQEHPSDVQTETHDQVERSFDNSSVLPSLTENLPKHHKTHSSLPCEGDLPPETVETSIFSASSATAEPSTDIDLRTNPKLPPISISESVQISLVRLDNQLKPTKERFQTKNEIPEYGSSWYLPPQIWDHWNQFNVLDNAKKKAILEAAGVQSQLNEKNTYIFHHPEQALFLKKKRQEREAKQREHLRHPTDRSGFNTSRLPSDRFSRPPSRGTLGSLTDRDRRPLHGEPLASKGSPSTPPGPSRVPPLALGKIKQGAHRMASTSNLQINPPSDIKLIRNKGQLIQEETIVTGGVETSPRGTSRQSSTPTVVPSLRRQKPTMFDSRYYATLENGAYSFSSRIIPNDPRRLPSYELPAGSYPPSIRKETQTWKKRTRQDRMEEGMTGRTVPGDPITAYQQSESEVVDDIFNSTQSGGRFGETYGLTHAEGRTSLPLDRFTFLRHTKLPQIVFPTIVRSGIVNQENTLQQADPDHPTDVEEAPSQKNYSIGELVLMKKKKDPKQYPLIASPKHSIDDIELLVLIDSFATVDAKFERIEEHQAGKIDSNPNESDTESDSQNEEESEESEEPTPSVHSVNQERNISIPETTVKVLEPTMHESQQNQDANTQSELILPVVSAPKTAPLGQNIQKRTEQRHHLAVSRYNAVNRLVSLFLDAIDVQEKQNQLTSTTGTPESIAMVLVPEPLAVSKNKWILAQFPALFKRLMEDDIWGGGNAMSKEEMEQESIRHQQLAQNEIEGRNEKERKQRAYLRQKRAKERASRMLEKQKDAKTKASTPTRSDLMLTPQPVTPGKMGTSFPKVNSPAHTHGTSKLTSSEIAPETDRELQDRALLQTPLEDMDQTIQTMESAEPTSRRKMNLEIDVNTGVAPEESPTSETQRRRRHNRRDEEKRFTKTTLDWLSHTSLQRGRSVGRKTFKMGDMSRTRSSSPMTISTKETREKSSGGLKMPPAAFTQLVDFLVRLSIGEATLLESKETEETKKKSMQSAFSITSSRGERVDAGKPRERESSLKTDRNQPHHHSAHNLHEVDGRVGRCIRPSLAPSAVTVDTSISQTSESTVDPLNSFVLQIIMVPIVWLFRIPISDLSRDTLYLLPNSLNSVVTKPIGDFAKTPKTLFQFVHAAQTLLSLNIDPLISSEIIKFFSDVSSYPDLQRCVIVTDVISTIPKLLHKFPRCLPLVAQSILFSELTKRNLSSKYIAILINTLLHFFPTPEQDPQHREYSAELLKPSVTTMLIIVYKHASYRQFDVIPLLEYAIQILDRENPSLFLIVVSILNRFSHTIENPAGTPKVPASSKLGHTIHTTTTKKKSNEELKLQSMSYDCQQVSQQYFNDPVVDAFSISQSPLSSPMRSPSRMSTLSHTAVIYQQMVTQFRLKFSHTFVSMFSQMLINWFDCVLAGDSGTTITEDDVQSLLVQIDNEPIDSDDATQFSDPPRSSEDDNQSIQSFFSENEGMYQVPNLYEWSGNQNRTPFLSTTVRRQKESDEQKANALQQDSDRKRARQDQALEKSLMRMSPKQPRTRQEKGKEKETKGKTMGTHKTRTSTPFQQNQLEDRDEEDGEDFFGLFIKTLKILSLFLKTEHDGEQCFDDEELDEGQQDFAPSILSLLLPFSIHLLDTIHLSLSYWTAFDGIPLVTQRQPPANLCRYPKLVHTLFCCTSVLCKFSANLYSVSSDRESIASLFLDYIAGVLSLWRTMNPDAQMETNIEMSMTKQYTSDPLQDSGTTKQRTEGTILNKLFSPPVPLRMDSAMLMKIITNLCGLSEQALDLIVHCYPDAPKDAQKAMFISLCEHSSFVRVHSLALPSSNAFSLLKEKRKSVTSPTVSQLSAPQITNIGQRSRSGEFALQLAECRRSSEQNKTRQREMNDTQEDTQTAASQSTSQPPILSRDVMLCWQDRIYADTNAQWLISLSSTLLSQLPLLSSSLPLPTELPSFFVNPSSFISPSVPEYVKDLMRIIITTFHIKPPRQVTNPKHFLPLNQQLSNPSDDPSSIAPSPSVESGITLDDGETGSIQEQVGDMELSKSQEQLKPSVSTSTLKKLRPFNSRSHNLSQDSINFINLHTAVDCGEFFYTNPLPEGTDPNSMDEVLFISPYPTLVRQKPKTTQSGSRTTRRLVNTRKNFGIAIPIAVPFSPLRMQRLEAAKILETDLCGTDFLMLCIWQILSMVSRKKMDEISESLDHTPSEESMKQSSDQSSDLASKQPSKEEEQRRSWERRERLNEYGQLIFNLLNSSFFPAFVCAYRSLVVNEVVAQAGLLTLASFFRLLKGWLYFHSQEAKNDNEQSGKQKKNEQKSIETASRSSRLNKTITNSKQSPSSKRRPPQPKHEETDDSSVNEEDRDDTAPNQFLDVKLPNKEIQTNSQKETLPFTESIRQKFQNKDDPDTISMSPSLTPAALYTLMPSLPGFPVLFSLQLPQLFIWDAVCSALMIHPHLSNLGTYLTDLLSSCLKLFRICVVNESKSVSRENTQPDHLSRNDSVPPEDKIRTPHKQNQSMKLTEHQPSLHESSSDQIPLNAVPVTYEEQKSEMKVPQPDHSPQKPSSPLKSKTSRKAKITPGNRSRKEEKAVHPPRSDSVSDPDVVKIETATIEKPKTKQTKKASKQ